MIMRQEEASGFTIRIPWDSNTVRGFVIALGITALWLIIGHFLETDSPPSLSRNDSTRIAIPESLVNVYLGNEGKGKGSKGNMHEEGTIAKGQPLKSNLESASAPKTAPRSAVTKAVSATELSTRLIPTKNVANHNDKNDKKKPTSDENTSPNKTNISDNSSTVIKGEPKGSENGTGLGDKGLKGGKGSGIGDIDWGGGNRICTTQPSLNVPSGMTTSSKIKIRFKVTPGGDVVFSMPLQRGEPRLEQLALDAVRKMKFNRIDDSQGDMVGIVTVTFNIN